MHLAAAPGTTPDTSTTSDWLSTIGNVLTQGMSLYQQMKLQDLNMKLIQQGKPPLTADQMYSMAPQLNVGLSPDVKSAILNYSLVIGGLGIGAFILFSAMRGGRR